LNPGSLRKTLGKRRIYRQAVGLVARIFATLKPINAEDVLKSVNTITDLLMLWLSYQ
jgi:hypothetical protein